MHFVMFSKMLGSLSVAEAGETVKGLGFDGVDLTVRPGGHVLPEKVKAALPKAVETLRAAGLTVPMISTGVVAADAEADEVFGTAAQCGIHYLKLGYWKYEGFGTIEKGIEATRKKLAGLEKLAHKHNVRACIHSHSGNMLSAEGGVVYLLLKDFDPHALGAYVDPGHMTAEGGVSGWKICMDLLKDRISLIAAKSFGWFREPARSAGGDQWHEKLLPLREGTVRWPEVFACLKQIGYNNVISLHSEYQGAHSWRDLTLDELIAQTREDLQYLKTVWRA